MSENASGGHRSCVTCKMGIDPLAVESPDLKVIGVEGLRVDGSPIIPHVPGRYVDPSAWRPAGRART